MKTKSLIKLLLGLSLISIGYNEFLEKHLLKLDTTPHITTVSANFISSDKSLSEISIPQNIPIQLVKKEPIIGAFSFIRFLVISPCRIISADQNGWIINDNCDGLPVASNYTLVKNINLLNCQTGIILNDKVNTLCPIRPRSSNAPPII